MIGKLPTTLTVSGEDYEINSDYRIALLIFEAYDDAELSNSEKAEICLTCLFGNNIPLDTQEALKQAIWFLDGGDMPKSKGCSKKLIDWKQDESIIFPAVNKAAGKEVRSLSYMHWWTFLGLFGEIGEGLFSSVMNIRQKKAKGKKLEKWEQEFYREHKELIDIKPHYTEAEQAEIDRLNKLLG